MAFTDSVRGGGPWHPANAVEQSMADAVAAGDSTAYFRLVESAQLFLPGSMVDRAAGVQRFVTRVMFGHTYVLVFTSVERLTASVAGLADASVATTYAELLRHWPDPTWLLAVNPGSPVDAYVHVGAVAHAARGGLPVTTAAQLIADADAGLAGSGLQPDAVDAALAEAVRTTDVNAYVHRLLGALVIVPTTAAVTGPAEILEPWFPWRITGGPEAPAVELFTSRAAFARAYPQPAAHVVAAFRFVLTAWPEGCGLSVNPDSPSGISLSYEILQMLQLWPTSGGAAR